MNKISQSKRNSELNYAKNITADYIFCFLRNFDIASAIWVLYMVYRGLPLWQIGIVEGIFHLTSFVCEVPSGALADLLGRKKIIILGRMLYVAAAVIQLFSTNVFSFAVAFMISAVSYNMNSGSEEALLYDSMKQIGKEEKYIGVNARLNVIIEVASGVATFVGGVCAEYSYALCYAMVVLVAVLSMIPAFTFTEPPMGQEQKEERVTLRTHFKSSIKIIKQNPEILKILVYYPLVNTFCTVVYFYGQQFFGEYGLNKIKISLVVLISSLLSCVGALYSEKILQIFGRKTKYMASVGMGISIVVMSGNCFALSVAGFALANFFNALLYPIQSASLNALIPSEQRATIISVDSMFFSCAMILFFPLSGVIASYFNLHIAFCILGLVQLMMMAVLRKGKKRKE